MKIASFNVNSIRARLPIVTAWLQAVRPDVLAVQETKVQDVDFPAASFEEIGYRCAYRGQKSYNGVGLLVATDIEDVRFGLLDEPKDEPRIIAARVSGLTIVNTYVPQGYMADSEKFQYKLKWFDRLLDYFQGRFKPSDPVVWVGDLNVAPKPIDVYDPEALLGHVCFHPDAQAAMEKLMRWGFVDTFRLHRSDAGQYTFWDYRMRNAFERNRGWRLDHIMATRTVAEKCTACTIDKAPRAQEHPSDHTPVVAEFDW
jgi:exodeoxyribonuclease-3